MVEVALTVARPDQKLCDRVTCVPKILSGELRMLLIFRFLSHSLSLSFVRKLFFTLLESFTVGFFFISFVFCTLTEQKLANSPTTKTGRYTLLASTLDNEILDQH